jgi:hypothetical protein
VVSPIPLLPPVMTIVCSLSRLSRTIAHLSRIQAAEARGAILFEGGRKAVGTAARGAALQR